MSAYDPNNVFARILRGELPCKKIYEDEFALAFPDIHPLAPVHVRVQTQVQTSAAYPPLPSGCCCSHCAHAVG